MTIAASSSILIVLAYLVLLVIEVFVKSIPYFGLLLSVGFMGLALIVALYASKMQKRLQRFKLTDSSAQQWAEEANKLWKKRGWLRKFDTTLLWETYCLIQELNDCFHGPTTQRLRAELEVKLEELSSP